MPSDLSSTAASPSSACPHSACDASLCRPSAPHRRIVPACVAAAVLMLATTGAGAPSVLTAAEAAQPRLGQSRPATGAASLHTTEESVHHRDQQQRAPHHDKDDGATPQPTVTTRRGRKGVGPDGACAVCDAFAEELERAIRYATSTDPQTMQSFLARLLQRYVMFWHPHSFLRQVVRAVYFVMSGEPERALAAVRDSSEALAAEMEEDGWHEKADASTLGDPAAADGRLSISVGGDGRAIFTEKSKDGRSATLREVGKKDAASLMKRITCMRQRSKKERGVAGRSDDEDGVGDEPQAEVRTLVPLMYRNGSSLLSTGVAYRKWDSGMALAVADVLSAEERGGGFPWAVAKTSSNADSEGEEPLGGSRSKQRRDRRKGRTASSPLGNVDATVFNPARFSGAVRGRQVIPLGAAAHTALALQEESAREREHERLTRRSSNSNGINDDAAKKASAGEEEKDGEEDMYAFHFTEVQPELCIAYNNTASHYAFADRRKKGEEGGGGKGEKEEELGGYDDEGPVLEDLTAAQRALTPAGAPIRDMNFGFAGRRLPANTATANAASLAASSFASLTRVDPAVAASLADMYPLGFVWVVENSNANGESVSVGDGPQSGTSTDDDDDWEGGASATDEPSLIGGLVNTVLSWVFSPGTLIGFPSSSSAANNGGAYVPSLTAPPQRSQLGRCFVPVPTRKGMSRAIALAHQGDEQRQKAQKTAKPKMVAQEAGNKKEKETTFKGFSPSDIAFGLGAEGGGSGDGRETVVSRDFALAIASASVSAAVSSEYLIALTGEVGSSHLGGAQFEPFINSDGDDDDGDGSSSLSSSLSVVTLDLGRGGVAEEGAVERPDIAAEAVANKKTKVDKKGTSISTTLHASRRQRLALSPAFTSSAALLVALEQVAKADALVATSREMIAVTLEGSALPLAGTKQPQQKGSSGTIDVEGSAGGRGLAAWVSSLAMSLTASSPAAASASAEAAMALALPREVFVMAMCPLLAASRAAAAAADGLSVVSVTDSDGEADLAEEPSRRPRLFPSAVAVSGQRGAVPIGSLFALPEHVFFTSYLAAEPAGGSAAGLSVNADAAIIPSTPAEVVNDKKDTAAAEEATITAAKTPYSFTRAAFGHWFTTIAAASTDDYANADASGAQHDRALAEASAKAALVVVPTPSAKALIPLATQRRSFDRRRDIASLRNAHEQSRAAVLARRKQQLAAKAASTSAVAQHHSKSILSAEAEERFMAFFEVYFEHSVALFSAMAGSEGRDDAAGLAVPKRREALRRRVLEAVVKKRGAGAIAGASSAAADKAKTVTQQRRKRGASSDDEL